MGTVLDEEMERYGVLGKPSDRDLTALVELAAQICGAPAAALTLLTGLDTDSDSNPDPDPESQPDADTGTGAGTGTGRGTGRGRGPGRLVASVGPETLLRAQLTWCAAALGNGGPVVLPDVRGDPRVRDHAPAADAVGFYASTPLLTPPGAVIGRLCVVDGERHELTWTQAQTQERALVMLADRVVDLLELRRRGRELEESLAELTRTQEQLRRSNRRLGYFAAQVSHDLRNPLTAMLLSAEAAAAEVEASGNHTARSLLAEVLEAGTRMSRVIDEVLAFAQVGAALRFHEVDLAAVMDLVARDLAPLLGERSARLRVEELPRVAGDAQALSSVLLNLVSNAVTYARPGVPPQVTVRATRREDRWRVEVIDNGAGIAASDEPRIFLPFERGTTREPGNGIGLATAKRLAEAHGGRIGLARRSPHGTVAWFEIPD